MDLALEQDEREESAEFEEFFNDILSEFQKFGKVIQLKACCNAGQHLRGNVYVQYEK